ncbi:MAG TPA: hypothetical protein VFD10_08220, partial [Atribacterota bacterium]|nr:hypothetical protein [Atribacterota bacterium]
VLDSSVMPFYFKGKIIETAIYSISFFQDILIAISFFYTTSFEIFIDDILLLKNKGERILSNIDMKEEYRRFNQSIKNNR